MKLYEHQQRALELTKDFNRCAYYVDMGGGKTFIGTQKMLDLGRNINLLVCQKSKVRDWVEHFRDYTDLTVFDATSARKDEKRAYYYGFWMNFDAGNRVVPSVIVINYDLMWRRPELLKLTGFTLMLDESSLIQNHTAKRTKFVLKMKPENVILLSGTPTSGRYERLWTQMHLLGWPISRKLYEQQYVIWDYIEDYNTGYRIPVVRGYKNIPRLKERMREYGCIFMKTEEFGIDLPDQQDITVRVPASAEYKRFMKTRVVTVEDRELVGGHTLTARMYARMLCGHFNKAKLKAVADLIDSTEDRIIIFYNWTAELDALKAIIDRPLSVVNGQTKDLLAYETQDNSVTLIQYQAGAHGLNLQKACRIIYFTLPESYELYAQSRKRIHRIGQDRKCFYYLMLCDGSIEERILKTLHRREEYNDRLFQMDFN